MASYYRHQEIGQKSSPYLLCQACQATIAAHVRMAEEQVVFVLYCSIVYWYILVDVQPLYLSVPPKTTAAVDPVNVGFVSLHGMTRVVLFPQFTLTLKLD